MTPAVLTSCAAAALAVAVASVIAMRVDRTAARHRLALHRPPSAIDSRAGAAAGDRIVVSMRRRMAGPSRSRLGCIEVADALDGIGRELRSGSALPAAIIAVQRTPPGISLLSDAVRRMRAGDTLARALAPGAASLDHSSRLALTTLAACATTGGPVSDTIERASATLREHAALDAERRAQASQARASMWVLTLVPLAFATWSAAADAGVRAFLVGTPAGWICLVGGTALSAAGWWWMRVVVEGTPS